MCGALLLNLGSEQNNNGNFPNGGVLPALRGPSLNFRPAAAIQLSHLHYVSDLYYFVR